MKYKKRGKRISRSKINKKKSKISRLWSNSKLRKIKSSRSSAKRKFKQIYPLGIRLFLFFAIVFLAVPLLITTLDVTAPLEATYMSIALFAFIAISMFVYFLWNRLIKHKWSINWFDTTLFFGVAGVFLALHFAARYSVTSAFAYAYPTTYMIFSSFLYLMMVFFLATGVFGSNFIQVFYRELILLVSIVIPYASATMLLRANWHLFSEWIIKLNVWLIQIVFYNIPDLVINYTFNGDPTFTLESFKVIIGAPCAGIDSLVLFTGFFILIGLLDWTKLIHIRFLTLLPIGLAGMFGMSVLRIFLLMTVGAFYDPALALSLFHTNLGWVLFVGYFFVFMLFAYPFMKKKS